MHQYCFLLYRLLVNPPKTLAQSPARIASTSAAINYVISQINNSNTAETALHQVSIVCVCVYVCVHVCVYVCVCMCVRDFSRGQRGHFAPPENVFAPLSYPQ